MAILILNPLMPATSSQQAVQIAGLKQKIPLIKPHRQWSQESVVAAIQHWQASGKKLTDISKFDQGLYSVAKTKFGSWGQALAAAGFESHRHRWSRMQIIAEIQQHIRFTTIDSFPYAIWKSVLRQTWRESAALSAWGYLVANRLDRYAIGDRSNMKPNLDSSLTI